MEYKELRVYNVLNNRIINVLAEIVHNEQGMCGYHINSNIWRSLLNDLEADCLDVINIWDGNNWLITGPIDVYEGKIVGIFDAKDCTYHCNRKAN